MTDYVNCSFDATNISHLPEMLSQSTEQRLILVAAKFRKEVTATALWLMGNGITLQCFQVTPYQIGEQLLLDAKQIIPLKETEEYLIKVAQKQQETKKTKQKQGDLQNVRRRFWEQVLATCNKKMDLFSGVSPSKEHWLSAGSGIGGVHFTFVFSPAKGYVQVHLHIGKSNIEHNKTLFDQLLAQKNEIESELKAKLIWDRREGEKSCGIIWQVEMENLLDEDSWPNVTEKLVEMMELFYGVMAGRIKEGY